MRKRDEKIPTLSAKEALILELFLLKPTTEMYGLELVKNSGGRIKRGTVYVTLSRMADKGYVESRQEEPQQGAIGLPRRLYKTTGYGQKVYEAWRIVREATRLLANPTEGLA